MKRKITNFTAVLLAGGRSTRMGRDKAALVLGGEPLWQRQLATLRATGAHEILVSGRRDGPYADCGFPIVEDLAPGAGPLAALQAVLAGITTPRVIVLAIDLPAMRAEFLLEMLALSIASARCAVAEDHGLFEPLAAVYDRAILSLIEECLRGADHSMQHLLRLAEARGLVARRTIREEDRPLFRNLNSPADLDEP